MHQLNSAMREPRFIATEPKLRPSKGNEIQQMFDNFKEGLRENQTSRVEEIHISKTPENIFKTLAHRSN